MIEFKIDYILSFLVLVLGTATLSGQSETRPVQVRTLALDSKPIAGLFVETKSGYQELKFSVYQPSVIVQAQALETLRIYRQQPNAESEPSYVVFKQLELPQDGRRILLIGLQSDAGVGLIPIQDNFGAGDSKDWLLVNASSKPLAFQVGSETAPIPVPALQSIPMRIDVPAGKGATIRVAARYDEGWKKFYSTFWPVYANQRCLVLFVPDGDSIRVRNFFEVIEPDESDAEL